MNQGSPVPLGELVEAGDGLIRTGPFGSQLHQSDYSANGEGTPVVMPKDMSDGRISLATIARVGLDKIAELSHHQLIEGDIVLARRGDVGRCAWVGPEEAGFLCGTGSMRISVGSGPLHARFLFYALLSDGCRSWLQGRAVGATMPNLNASIVSDLPVPYMPTPSQVRVADVLTAFDQLIENNRRRVEILEEAARSLYREWFVRFRFPGHESTEAGCVVPRDWSPVALGAIADINPDKVDPTGWAQLRYLDISALGDRAVRWPPPISGSEAPGRARRGVADGDVVHSMVRPNRRGHGLVIDPPEDGVASTGLAVLRPRTVPSAFLFELVSNQSFTDYLVGRASGAAYPAVKPVDFEAAPVSVPAAPVLMKFAEVAEPLHRTSAVLASQNDALAEARDLLLPKLVTGQIDVESLGVDDVFGWAELEGAQTTAVATG